jgi:beta-lactamase superfamily II metal-dependent hydrolase
MRRHHRELSRVRRVGASATVSNTASLLVLAAAWLLSGGALGQEARMRVHVIDVGQGSASLIEFPCGTMLIDTGGEATTWKVGDYVKVFGGANAAVSYVQGFFNARAEFEPRLDLLLLTHPHIDHTGGVPQVLRQFRPRHVVDNGEQRDGSGIGEQVAAATYASSNAGVERWFVREATIPDGVGLTNGTIDPIACAGVDPLIRVLWGTAESDPDWHRSEYADQNNHSVVVRIDYGEASILFTGDLEESEKGRSAGIERLLAKYGDSELLDVDVYHVGHHGSANGNTTALAREVSPEIAVLSHGPACSQRRGFSAWGHRHPRKETIDELVPTVTGSRPPKSVRIYDDRLNRWETRTLTQAIYTTGWDGTLVLEATADGVWRVVAEGAPDACLP